MKIPILLFALLGFSLANGGQTIAVSGGGGLTIFRVNGTVLEKAQSIPLDGSTGPMGLSPDQTLLYVNTSIASPDGKKSKSTSGLATFRVESDGTLNLLHTANSVWNSGYLRADATGQFLAGNNYRHGKVGIWKLDEDGIYRGAPPRDFELEKKAHSAVFSPDNRFLFVPATGPNKIFQLVFKSESGAIYPNQPSSAPGPQGEDDARQPRHLIFHPTKDFAYTTNEREQPGVGVWAFDRTKGRLESIQALPSTDGDSEKITTADLHLSKDNRFLYVSNRDLNKSGEPRDTIAVFAVDDTSGTLDFVKRFPCERIPRSFAMGNEGKLLFVSGQGDSKLGVYQIDSSNGHLTRSSSHDLPGVPRWVTVLPAKN